MGKGEAEIVFKPGQLICPFRGHSQRTRPTHLTNHAWVHNGIPDGSPDCRYLNAYNNTDSPARWVRMAAHEDLANCKLRTLPASQGGGLGFIAIDDIWHGQEILMVNREYSNQSTKDSRELLSVVSHGGDMQEEPELMVTSESDNTEVDLTIPSSQQYATLTDTGG